AINIPDGFYNSGNLATGTPAATLTGSYEGIPWGIQAYQPPATPGGSPVLGTNLLIDTGASQELVNVLGIDSPPAVPAGSAPPPSRVILSGTPTLAHAGPIAVTPVNTITAWAPIAAGAGPTAIN